MTRLLEPLSVLRMKVVTTFHRRVVCLARELTPDIPLPNAAIPIDVRMLKTEDLDAYRRFRPREPTGIARQRIEQGDRCFVAWHEGEIVNAGWVATSRVYVPYLERDIILDGGDVFIYDAHTHRRFRKLGVYRSRAAFVLRHYRDAGARRAIVVIAVENRVPFRTVEQLGYRPVGYYASWRIGPWRRHQQQAEKGKRLPTLAEPRTRARIGDDSNATR